MNMTEMLYDYLHDLAAVLMARKTVKTVNWAAVLPFPEAQWLHYDFAREEVSLFSTPGNICVTVSGVQHQVELPVLAFVQWHRSPPARASARASTLAFHSERFPAGSTPPPLFPKVSLAANGLSSAPPLASRSLSVEPVPVASLIA